MLNKKLGLYGFILATGLLLSSCEDSRTYDRYHSVTVEGWEFEDTIKFDIPKQANGDYSLNLGLRTTEKYPFKNIKLVITTTLLPQRTTFHDTLTVNIFDEKGRLDGNNNISSSDLLFRVRDLQIKKNDSLYVNIFHLMERESLPGLTDIGVQLKRH